MPHWLIISVKPLREGDRAWHSEVTDAPAVDTATEVSSSAAPCVRPLPPDYLLSWGVCYFPMAAVTN